VRLTGPFRPEHEIRDYQITADSARVVFLADLRVDQRFEVYSVPIDGGTPFDALNAPLSSGQQVTGFQLSAEGRRVVYRSDQRNRGTFELFVAPADAGAPAERVLPGFPLDRDVGAEFRVAPDGTRAVFLADLDTPGLSELYTVALGGAPELVKLSPPLAPGGGVLGGLQLSPDGAQVVYRADPEGDGAVGLYAARLDGGAPPHRLFEPPAGRALGRSEISADSSRALFQLSGGAVELLSVPLDGSAPAAVLHPPLVAGGDVVRFELAGTRVVYRADQEADEVLELYSAPIDASAPPVRLHPPLAPGRAVLPDFRVSSDGRWVGFLADLAHDERFELFVAPGDGSAPPRLASDPVATAPAPVGDVRAMAPAGDFVVYTADQERDEVVELYSAPRDGRRAPVRLHAPATAGGDVAAFAVTADERRVVFDGDLETDGVDELYSAPVDAGAPAVKLSGALVAGGAVRAWRVSPDGTAVVFAADALRAGQVELFRVPADGGAPPTRLDPPPHRTFGSVERLELTPDGRSVVYTSDRAQRGRFELYAVALDGGAPPVRLSHVAAPGGDVLDFRIGPDSARVVYRADQETDELPELYGAPLDASAPPVKLSVPLAGNQRVWDYALGAGERVVFTAGLASRRELWSVPVDGSAPPVGFLSPQARVFDLWLTPRGTRVLFRAQNGDGRLHVYCAPIDGSSAPVHLDGPIPRYKFFAPLFPDEDAVVYFAGTTGGPSGTYRTRLDGSAPPVHLDAHGAPHGLSADGRQALVYGSLGDIVNDGLYVLPLDGSAPAVRLSQRLPPGASVLAGAFAAGGDVLYIADEERLGVRELYASGAAFAPARGTGIDGSATRTR
jgi:Tol biopolymer transport system component